jgi:hypothetical protein
MQLINFVTSVLPKLGSGSVSRFGTSLRLGILKDLPIPCRHSLTPTVSDAYREQTQPPSGKRLWRFSAGVNRSPLDSNLEELASF